MNMPMPQMKKPTLEEVLAYSNRDVVYRFRKTYGLTWEESEDIFDQVKKWLWMANHRRSSGISQGLSIDLSLVVIDEMWHNFVLFTKEYTEFCLHYFGYYLHHGPATEAEDLEQRERTRGLGPAERAEAIKNARRPQYEYIYDVLGEETFAKWYMEYPKRYSYLQLAEMQLQAVNDAMAAIRPRAQAEESRQHQTN
ncbi:hypothetical protein QAA18_04850 [Luteimonas sp. 8-5]|uniref:glycine-rich domain-containing protein n=1 Tax=Luteimonas sp. 8-5 TaxID=3039387 RepID=UPI002436B9B8|nr:hypothetical protein [Luteimonas sp. 8-5]MDG6348069.1 hypothetical protein [Luteimonas sp. 8-5]